jgi:hypothetical protein
MRLRSLLVAILAVVLGATFSSSALGGMLGTEDPASAEETELTSVVEGPVEQYCGRPGTPDEPILLAARKASIRAAETNSEDCAMIIRCRRVDVARRQKSFTGLFVVFRFWHWKRWCYDWWHIFNITRGTYVTDVDGNQRYRGITSAWEHYDEWCCGIQDSGHLSFRQGRFDNCVYRLGCIGSVYPWVQIHAHANGTYHHRTGT